MKHVFLLSVMLAAVIATSCSKASTPAPEATPTLAPQNTTGFPLYEGSEVLASKEFSQTITSRQAGTGIMSSGAGTYTGNEVIAGSTAPLSQLEAWLHQSAKQPPSPFTAVTIPSSMSSAYAIATKNGVDFVLFRDAKNPKHGLIVVAMDPSAVHSKLGPAIALVSKYEALPQGLRQGLDTQLKQRFGYTASEFVQPGSPLGTAVGAMTEFEHKNERAIIIIDATKQS
jgi:hypothetical protein